MITALKGSPYDPHKTAEQREAEEHLDVDVGEGGDGVNNLYSFCLREIAEPTGVLPLTRAFALLSILTATQLILSYAFFDVRCSRGYLCSTASLWQPLTWFGPPPRTAGLLTAVDAS